MPYIAQQVRSRLDPHVQQLVDALRATELLSAQPIDMEGNLNYVITKILMSIYEDVKYSNINKAQGVLSCVSHEFYRIVAAPYEDQKKYENGEVERCQNNHQL